MEVNPPTSRLTTALLNKPESLAIGLVRQELLSGIKTASQFSKLQEILRSFPDEPLTTPDYEAAAAAGNQCRGKGSDNRADGPSFLLTPISSATQPSCRYTCTNCANAAQVSLQNQKCCRCDRNVCCISLISCLTDLSVILPELAMFTALLLL